MTSSHKLVRIQDTDQPPEAGKAIGTNRTAIEKLLGDLVPVYSHKKILLVRQYDATHGLLSGKKTTKTTTVVVFSFLQHQLPSDQFSSKQCTPARLF